jgi:LPXTG-motif cell wall-anchored protein
MVRLIYLTEPIKLIIVFSGKTDVDCPGRNTVTGNSTILSRPQPPSSSSKSSKTPIIVGVVVGVVGLLLLLLAGWWFMRRRRANSNRPTPFDADPKTNPAARVEYEPYTDFGGVPPSAGYSTNGKYTTAPSDYASSARPESAYTNNGRPGHLSYNRPGSSSAGQHSPTRDSHIPLPGASRASKVPPTHAEEEEIIIQHRDGGAPAPAPAVRELPPPYANHGAGSSSNPDAGAENPDGPRRKN